VGLFGSVEIQRQLGLGHLDGGRREHHRLLRFVVLFGFTVVFVFVLVEGLVEVVLGRPPVRIASVPGCRSPALEQSAAGRAVEDARRQRHVARSPHGISLADQHRDQHEEPEHYKRDPKE
jgi:hypothetical protein